MSRGCSCFHFGHGRSPRLSPLVLSLCPFTGVIYVIHVIILCHLLANVTSNDLDVLILRVIFCSVKSPAANSICGFQSWITEKVLLQGPLTVSCVHLVARHGVRENNNSVAPYHPHFLSWTCCQKQTADLPWEAGCWVSAERADGVQCYSLTLQLTTPW